MPARDEILRAGFAADQQQAQQRQLPLDRREQGRAAGKTGDAVFAQEVGELVTDQAQARPRRDDRRARQQRHPDLLDREVEDDRHALVDAVARTIAVELGGDAHEIADAGVPDGDALRIAGRARGVDDVADRIGGRRNLGQPLGRLSVDPALRLVEKDLLHLERREALLVAGHRDDRLDLGIVDDEAHAFGGKCRIERHVGGVHLQHRQHRHIGLGALVEQEADAVAGLNALLDQVARDLIGAAVEIAEREHGIVRDDGIAGGETGAGLFEQVIEPFARRPAHRVVGVLARDHLRPAERAADRLDHVAQLGPQPVGRVQLDDRGTSGTARAQIADIGRLVHRCLSTTKGERSRQNADAARPPKNQYCFGAFDSMTFRRKTLEKSVT